MYLCNRDIQWAIRGHRLIVDPPPEHFGAGYDETSIDLHLDDIKEAKVWDIARFQAREARRGSRGPELYIGTFNYAAFAEEYLIDPPDETVATETDLVRRRGPEMIVKPRGFLLWQTEEKVGTPVTNAGLICFVDGKSTRARTGILVHLTAPTIHAGWNGKIVLEIINLGPFDFVLRQKDVIAQLTVATVFNPPDPELKRSQSSTAGQEHVTGTAARQRTGGRRRQQGA